MRTYEPLLHHDVYQPFVLISYRLKDSSSLKSMQIYPIALSTWKVYWYIYYQFITKSVELAEQKFIELFLI